MNAAANAVRGTLQAWPFADPASVKAASDGPYSVRMICQLTDEELLAHSTAELKQIARVATDGRIDLDDGGLPAAPLDERARSEAPARAARIINGGARRVLAIREELRRRAELETQAERRRRAEARQVLEDLCEKGPAALAVLVDHAGAAVEAHVRMAALVRDLELLADLSRVQTQYGSLREAVHLAAGAMGKKMPELPALPVLPDRQEIDRLVRALVPQPAMELLHDLALPKLPARRAAEALKQLSEK